MGYTTYFGGEFFVTPRLAPEHREYLIDFAETRRMKRDATKAALLKDTVRDRAGLAIGKDGGYFVGGGGMCGQEQDASIVDYNAPPEGQPGLWCQWVPSAEGDSILWDDGEKFYAYIDWIEYLVEHFIKPWGYKLNGVVYWTGEDNEDHGMIEIVDNLVTTKIGRIAYDSEGNETLKPGRYSVFVLQEDCTWEQPVFGIDKPMTEHDFRMNAEANCGGFISFGVQEDSDSPDDVVRRF